MIPSEAMKLCVHGVEFQLAIPAENNNAQHFRKLFQDRGQYEAVMAAILAKLLQTLPNPVFVDMGAFLGYYTCYAAKLLNGRGLVYAVESNPDYVAALNQAVLLNSLDNVRILHAALSDRIEPLRAVDNTVVADDGETQGHAVISTTFDTLCRETGLKPTIAKMDVHGFEGRILGGMEETLRHSLQFLLLELHPNSYLRRYAPGISRMQILDRLEDAGFHNYFVAGHRYTWSDGMQVFFDSGRFAYQVLSRKTVACCYSIGTIIFSYCRRKCLWNPFWGPARWILRLSKRPYVGGHLFRILSGAQGLQPAPHRGAALPSSQQFSFWRKTWERGRPARPPRVSRRADGQMNAVSGTGPSDGLPLASLRARCPRS